MAGQFNPGDIVRLKSGGPKMTVAFKEEVGGGYLCQWFDGTKPMSQSFDAAVLESAAGSGTRPMRRP